MLLLLCLVIVGFASAIKRGSAKQTSLISEIRKNGRGAWVAAFFACVGLLVGIVGGELVGMNPTTPSDMAFRYAPYYLVMVASFIPAVLLRLRN